MNPELFVWIGALGRGLVTGCCAGLGEEEQPTGRASSGQAGEHYEVVVSSAVPRGLDVLRLERRCVPRHQVLDGVVVPPTTWGSRGRHEWGF